MHRINGLKLAAVVAVALSPLLAAAPAMAAPAFVDPRQAPKPDSFIAWSVEHGVADETIDDLVAKLEAGQFLESMNPDAEPVEIATKESSAAFETIATFADGSISVSKFEKPGLGLGAGKYSALGIAGCTTYNGGGFVTYTNCKISESNGTVTMAFKANYSRSATSATISSNSGATVTSNYGTATQPDWTTVRRSATASQPAVVTSHSHFTSWNGASSEDLYLSLRVSFTTSWTTQY